MKKYEFTFPSVNSEVYPKPITVAVVEPDTINRQTGAMLFSHGWGGNRFQHADKMEYTAGQFNLICISVEYRQSGYDFNPVTGLGAYRPYDASFYQVFDSLNALRQLLELRPKTNRRRLFHYGGSQGGHIALLTSVYVPNTFAFAYASCPLTHLDDDMQAGTGRSFNADELSIRSIYDHADLIQTPIHIEYGDTDSTVNCQQHSQPLEIRLKELGKKAWFKCYPGGEHDLMPTISKLEAFKENVPELMQTMETDGQDDFLQQNVIKIKTPNNELTIDWSKPTDSTELFKWEHK